MARGRKCGKRCAWILVLTPQIEHPCENKIHKNYASFYFFSHSGFILFFGFLPMAHSLHVQVDFCIHGNFFPRLIGD